MYTPCIHLYEPCIHLYIHDKHLYTHVYTWYTPAYTYLHLVHSHQREQIKPSFNLSPRQNGGALSVGRFDQTKSMVFDGSYYLIYIDLFYLGTDIYVFVKPFLNIFCFK